MQEDLHPPYYPTATVTCACGRTFTVGSTKPEIRVEVCAACHPFYTSQKRFVDTGGRVERFAKLAERAAKVKGERARQKAAPRRKKPTQVLSEKQWKKLSG